IGLMFLRKPAIGSMCSCRSRTPAWRAAAYASSGTGSQAPNTRSSSAARGTNSRISGARLSVRLPRRMVPIWVTDPIGRAAPRRTFSTPAMNVLATAPSPTHNTPSLPSAGAICRTVVSATAVSFCQRVQRRPLDDSWFVHSLDRLSVQPLFREQSLVHLLCMLIHIYETLHHRDKRGERQQGYHRFQQQSVGTGAGQQGRETDQQDPFGPLRDPHFAVEPQPFGARPGIGDQQ